jgi:hypothetical protein
MLRITVTVGDEAVFDRVIQGIQGIEDRSTDLQPFWPHLVTVFQGIVAQAFASEGASTGAPWPPLAPSTQAERRRLGFPPAHPILQRTGTLKRALTVGEGAFIATTPTSMRYLVSQQTVPYFKYFHGSRAILPRRVPTLLTPANRKRLWDSIQLYVTRGKML